MKRQAQRETKETQDRPTTHYIWRTRGDGKVRDTHRANNGKIFAWEDPPLTGNPGEDYGCRCRAEAYEPENTNQQAEENAPSITSSLSELVPPSDGLFGTHWEFKAGRDIRFEAQSTNVIGFVGFRAYYRVYALEKNGKVIPVWKNRNPQSKQIGSYIVPMDTHEETITADFSSSYGYYWIINAMSARTVDNESYIFYRIYR